MIGSLNNSLHGRPIEVTVVSPTTPIFVHHAYDSSGGHAKNFDVLLAISNPGAAALIAEVTYAGLTTYLEVSVAAHDTKMVTLTIAGDSPTANTTDDTSVGVRLAAGQSGQLNVTGGWRA